jgi:Protein of unknown function (DUF3455)
LRYLITANTMAFFIGIGGQPASANGITVPPVPTNIQVPSGNVAFLKAHALGTQNYICKSSSSGFVWTFFSPEATLFLNVRWINGDISQQITTHFLSPNPAEKDLARVTWQHSFDTSRVWGRGIQSSSDPNFVQPGAIPWLLVEKVGVQRGPTGGDTLAKTTFIHRLNTTGGVAPSIGCSVSTDTGNTVLVPYTADYIFYKKTSQ